MLHLKFHHFSQGFDWECWILKIFKEKLSENWKNKGRPTKSAIYVRVTRLSQQKWSVPPTLGKVSTKKINVWVLWDIYTYTNAPPCIIWYIKSEFGNTLICGSLFTGTLYGSIHAIYYYNESDPWLYTYYLLTLVKNW